MGLQKICIPEMLGFIGAQANVQRDILRLREVISKLLRSWEGPGVCGLRLVVVWFVCFFLVCFWFWFFGVVWLDACFSLYKLCLCRPALSSLKADIAGKKESICHTPEKKPALFCNKEPLSMTSQLTMFNNYVDDQLVNSSLAYR